MLAANVCTPAFTPSALVATLTPSGSFAEGKKKEEVAGTGTVTRTVTVTGTGTGTVTGTGKKDETGAGTTVDAGGNGAKTTVKVYGDVNNNGEMETGLGNGYTKWARKHYNVMVDIKDRRSWEENR